MWAWGLGSYLVLNQLLAYLVTPRLMGRSIAHWWLVGPRTIERRDEVLPDPGPAELRVRVAWTALSPGSNWLGDFSFVFLRGVGLAGIADSGAISKPQAGSTARISGSIADAMYLLNSANIACGSSPGRLRNSKSNTHSAGTMLSAVPPRMTPVCTVVCATSNPRSYGPRSR